jgi:hypothetical protein
MQQGMSMPCRSFVALCVALAALILPSLAQAAVRVHFYSREFGNQFPHAFIMVEGTIDATGRRVAANYGFTAALVTPSILTAPVAGYVQTVEPAYIAGAQRQFTVTLDDAGYRRLMIRIARWQARPQPAYRLDTANCVHFVMDLAEVAGLKVNRTSAFFKRPRRFLEEVRALNRGLR